MFTTPTTTTTTDNGQVFFRKAHVSLRLGWANKKETKSENPFLVCRFWGWESREGGKKKTNFHHVYTYYFMNGNYLSFRFHPTHPFNPLLNFPWYSSCKCQTAHLLFTYCQDISITQVKWLKMVPRNLNLRHKKI